MLEKILDNKILVVVILSIVLILSVIVVAITGNKNNEANENTETEFITEGNEIIMEDETESTTEVEIETEESINIENSEITVNTEDNSNDDAIKDNTNKPTNKPESGNKKPVDEESYDNQSDNKVLQNAPYKMYEVFLEKHYKNGDYESYVYAFYMPVNCDMNSKEFNEAHAELWSKIKGEWSVAEYGEIFEFADLGKCWMYSAGYLVPTEKMPETLVIKYEENGHGPQYYFYYTKEQEGSDAFLEVYNEFVSKYEVIDENGYNNLHYSEKYFEDGKLYRITAYLN